MVMKWYIFVWKLYFLQSKHLLYSKLVYVNLKHISRRGSGRNIHNQVPRIQFYFGYIIIITSILLHMDVDQVELEYVRHCNAVGKLVFMYWWWINLCILCNCLLFLCICYVYNQPDVTIGQSHFCSVANINLSDQR